MDIRDLPRHTNPCRRVLVEVAQPMREWLIECIDFVPLIPELPE